MLAVQRSTAAYAKAANRNASSLIVRRWGSVVMPVRKVGSGS